MCSKNLIKVTSLTATKSFEGAIQEFWNCAWNTEDQKNDDLEYLWKL